VTGELLCNHVLLLCIARQKLHQLGRVLAGRWGTPGRLITRVTYIILGRISAVAGLSMNFADVGLVLAGHVLSIRHHGAHWANPKNFGCVTNHNHTLIIGHCCVFYDYLVYYIMYENLK